MVAGEPDDRVKQPERLQRLVERSRWLRGHALEHGRDIVLAEPACLRCVACGEREHGVDRLDRRIEELDRLRVAG